MLRPPGLAEPSAARQHAADPPMGHREHPRPAAAALVEPADAVVQDATAPQQTTSAGEVVVCLLRLRRTVLQQVQSEAAVLDQLAELSRYRRPTHDGDPGQAEVEAGIDELTDGTPDVGARRPRIGRTALDHRPPGGRGAVLTPPQQGDPVIEEGIHRGRIDGLEPAQEAVLQTRIHQGAQQRAALVAALQAPPGEGLDERRRRRDGLPSGCVQGPLQRPPVGIHLVVGFLQTRDLRSRSLQFIRGMLQLRAQRRDLRRRRAGRRRRRRLRRGSAGAWGCRRCWRSLRLGRRRAGGAPPPALAARPPWAPLDGTGRGARRAKRRRPSAAGPSCRPRRPWTRGGGRPSAA